MDGLLTVFLTLTNETLAAAIVIMAASLLLYNLSRNLHDRVARVSGILLACITVVYVCDVFLSLHPGRGTYTTVLRLQWLGIAYMPAALFHLSDALLATTGLPSRGRRRRIGRALYVLSTVFFLLAVLTDSLVEPIPYGSAVLMRGGPVFPVYIAYFVVAAIVAFYNVQRARQRCLTRGTRRRMAYLQFAMLTPAIGIFPFSVLIPPGEEFSLLGLVLVNVANVVVILMLLFLAYPLSFFGSRVPDRVVKVELLRFLMRGPATGMLALATIIFVAPATRILGLPGETFMPFAVVAVVLLWQWITHLTLPYLEKRLVYPEDEYEQLARFQNLSERLLTRTDLLQLLEAILAAACDYLRVSTAFVATLNDAEPEIAITVGPTRPNLSLLQDEADTLRGHLESLEDDVQIHRWHGYWTVPLRSVRTDPRNGRGLIGFLGIQARAAEIDLTADEWQMLRTFVRRAAQALDDLTLQSEIYAVLEGLLPQINLTRASAVAVEYKPGRQPATSEEPLLDPEQFASQVKAALTHYWGGPGLTSSRLLDLAVVRDALPANDNNPAKALRAVLGQAIENQRPEGERKMTDPEWTLYNILELRFIRRVKVRDAALRLALSEPDLYRKQKLAVQAVAETLLRMDAEHRRVQPQTEPEAEPISEPR